MRKSLWNDGYFARNTKSEEWVISTIMRWSSSRCRNNNKKIALLNVVDIEKICRIISTEHALFLNQKHKIFLIAYSYETKVIRTLPNWIDCDLKIEYWEFILLKIRSCEIVSVSGRREDENSCAQNCPFQFRFEGFSLRGIYRFA